LLVFQLHAATTGWIGIGISPKGGMQDADIWVGWVKDGKAVVQVRYNCKCFTG